MTEVSFKEVLLERRQEVLWLTLNRPEAANAINSAMRAQIISALTFASVDESVRAVVITGAGERVFSAGADLKEVPADVPPAVYAKRRLPQTGRMLLSIVDFEKPLVTAVKGVCSAFGFFIAMASDLTVAAEDASFVISEIDVCISTFPGLALLSYFAGPKVAADLTMTGRRISAREAERHGLVARVVPRESVVDEAQKLAALLGSKPPIAQSLNKRWLRRPFRQALTEAWDDQLATTDELYESGEPQKAIAAFFASRKGGG